MTSHTPSEANAAKRCLGLQDTPTNHEHEKPSTHARTKHANISAHTQAHTRGRASTLTPKLNTSPGAGYQCTCIRRLRSNGEPRAVAPRGRFPSGGTLASVRVPHSG